MLESGLVPSCGEHHDRDENAAKNIRSSFIEVDPQKLTEVRNLLNILARKIESNPIAESRRHQNRAHVSRKALHARQSRRINTSTSRTSTKYS